MGKLGPEALWRLLHRRPMLVLAITKKFCQMIGGDVTIESELRQGSSFTMRLPAEVSGSKAQPAPTIRVAPARKG